MAAALPALWFDPEMDWDVAPAGMRDRQKTYSDGAIQNFPTMKVLLGMAIRQTTGFVASLLRLIGLDWMVPDFRTASRRQKNLKVNIPYRGSQQPLQLLIGSTAILAECEFEWNGRKHGGTKRRIWRKIQIRIDEETLEVRAADFTTGDIGDAPMLPELLEQIPPDPVGRQRHRRRCFRHPQLPCSHRCPRRCRDHSAPQERQAPEA